MESFDDDDGEGLHREGAILRRWLARDLDTIVRRWSYPITEGKRGLGGKAHLSPTADDFRGVSGGVWRGHCGSRESTDGGHEGVESEMNNGV